MNVLKLFNDYSYLITDNQSIKNKLWEKLRFRPKDYFFRPAYKQKRWDGYVDFFHKTKGYFLTGLLPEVLYALSSLEISYKIEDSRDKIKPLHNEIDDQFLNQWLPSGMKPVTLENYQVDLVNQAIKSYYDGMQCHRGIIQAPTASGKAQPLDSLVLTTVGYIPMGSIEVGDQVAVPSGGFAKVTGVFPQGKKEILKITFENGDSVECCEDHLWKIGDKIVPAKELDVFDALPTPKRIDFIRQDPYFEPYSFGVFIGSYKGRKNNKIFLEIHNDRVKRELKGIFKLQKTCYPNRFYVNNDEHLNNVTKRIPYEYLHDRYESRKELLKGLMDSSGYVDIHGKPHFLSDSTDLQEDFKWLVQSLGGVYYSQGNFKVPFNPCKCRYLARYKKTKNITRKIVNIEHIGKKECQCIMVDHPEHLYITDNFLVTHNTYIMLSLMKCMPLDEPILFLANRKGVANQNYKQIVRWGFKNVGRFDGTIRKLDKITCATAQSLNACILSTEKAKKIKKEINALNYKLDLGKYADEKARKKDVVKVKGLEKKLEMAGVVPDFLSKVRVLIVDEVHTMMSKTTIAIFDKLSNAVVRYGISATPFKFEEKIKGKKEVRLIEGDNVHKYNVKGYFGPVFKTKVVEGGELTTTYLQDKGRLAKSICYFHPITEPQIPFDIYLDAVTNGIAQSVYFHEVVSRLAKSLKGRTLILVERLVHGDILQRLIPNSLWVQGKDDNDARDFVIEKLQKADNDVVAIATSGIFSAAIDVFVHNFINASGGKASHDVIQRIGRGLRTAEDKEILTYHDFLFHINPYLEKHSQKRIKILRNEGHNVIVKENIEF